MQTTFESLEKIKRKQAETSTKRGTIEIAKIEKDGALGDKPREAGLLAKEGSADNVLERLKKKQQTKSS